MFSKISKPIKSLLRFLKYMSFTCKKFSMYPSPLGGFKASFSPSLTSSAWDLDALFTHSQVPHQLTVK